VNGYELRLFVAGHTDRSLRSVAAVRQLVEDHLGEDGHLEVIDVLEDPDAAEQAKILATPTLVRSHPPPRRSVVGDLSDVPTVASALGLATINSNGNGAEAQR
jgi:circadian clock protein KaiB